VEVGERVGVALVEEVVLWGGREQNALDLQHTKGGEGTHHGVYREGGVNESEHRVIPGGRESRRLCKSFVVV
jgi:hypothetical protein